LSITKDGGFKLPRDITSPLAMLEYMIVGTSLPDKLNVLTYILLASFYSPGTSSEG
jgi:hypothetical protein